MTLNPIKIISALSLAIFLLFWSCSSTRKIEQSIPEKPPWIYSTGNNYIIQEGIGDNHDEAKQNALEKVKKRIASSIAQKISVTKELYQDESSYNGKYGYKESFKTYVKSKSDNIPFINGISLNKVVDYYWEVWREGGEKKIHYYIKYPFDQQKLDKLINEWIERDKKLTRELQNIEDRTGKHKTVKSLINDIYRINELKKILRDQRSNTASLILNRLIAEFKSIRIEVLYKRPGEIIYRLVNNGEPIRVHKNPKIKTNCAQVKKTESKEAKWRILYEYESCKLQDRNYVEINYDFEFSNISKKVYIDLSGKMVAIEVNEPVSFQSIDKYFFNNKRKIRCMIPVKVLSSLPFVIERVELNVKRKKTTFTGNTKDKELPSLVFDNLNFKMQGKGIHYFKITFYESLLTSLQYKSNSDQSSYVSGKIFYYVKETQKRKVFNLNKVQYTVNW